MTERVTVTVVWESEDGQTTEACNSRDVGGRTFERVAHEVADHLIWGLVAHRAALPTPSLNGQGTLDAC